MLPEKRQEPSEADLQRIFGDPPPEFEIVERDGHQAVRYPLYRRLAECGVPPKFRMVRWSTIDFTEIDKHSELRKTIEGFYKWKSDSELRSVILRSPPSRGKTTLAAAKFADVVASIGRRALWLSWPDLLNRFRSTMDNDATESASSILRFIKTRSFLVIDDLGKELTRRDFDEQRKQATQYALEKAYLIVNHLYQEQIPVIYTTELTYDLLRRRLDQAIADRVNECGVWIDLSPLSNRRR